jgi:hypothetical protein
MSTTIDSRGIPARLGRAALLLLIASGPLLTDGRQVAGGSSSGIAQTVTALDFRVGQWPLVPLEWAQLFPKLGKPWPKAAPSPVDSDGVPMKHSADGTLYYSPTGVAIGALRRLSSYVMTGDRDYLEITRRWARRLSQMMVRHDGALWLPFERANRNQGLDAPWYNALAQGVALALYSRLHRLLGLASDLATADGLARSLQTLRGSGAPWVTTVDGDGYVWFEHFAGGFRGHVLNAHIYATFGLRDYWQETRSPDARRLLEGAITTMRDKAHLFRRVGTYSWYCLVHRVAHRKYQRFHIRELRALSVATGSPYFARLAARFAADYR